LTIRRDLVGALMQEFANTSIVIEAINEAKEQLLIDRYSGAGTIH
jgi:hypothetical protein